MKTEVVATLAFLGDAKSRSVFGEGLNLALFKPTSKPKVIKCILIVVLQNVRVGTIVSTAD
jgi:hypothetical protein